MSHSEDEVLISQKSSDDDPRNFSGDDGEADDIAVANGRDKSGGENKSITSTSAILSLEERREKAKLISSMRILSQKEFAKVRQVQLAKKVDAALPKR